MLRHFYLLLKAMGQMGKALFCSVAFSRVLILKPPSGFVLVRNLSLLLAVSWNMIYQTSETNAVYG